MLAAEAAAAVNLALSPEAKEAEAARNHSTPAQAETRRGPRDEQPGEPRHLDAEPESQRKGINGGDSTSAGDNHADAEPHDHHLLIDAHEDRWAWRRKIRQSPRKLFFYRICVALLGLLLLCVAAITGPLPGPGGIPIALLGIAVWSSEFEWAQRLMYWFKAQLKRYLAWPRSHRILFWAVFGLGCATLAYLFLLTFGVPFWVPEFAAKFLRQLPGV